MTTDPGDLVLDPTCGSGTTAYVAEQWGRRWITIDTSRVALALARPRLMAAKYPYYYLADSPEGVKNEAEATGKIPPDYKTEGDIKKGFVYKRVPHVTLKSIANNPDIKEGMSREEIDVAIARHAETETLYDQPYEDNNQFKPDGKTPSDKIIADGQKQYGKLPILLARMNPDLAMGEELLKKTGAGNLFMVFGEPDLKVKKVKDDKITVEINGVDVCDPTTDQIRSFSTDDIACWFVYTNYNGESFFVRHAYFLGADEPYEKLKRALCAEVDESVWSMLYSAVSQPFDNPKTGKIAVKVINHYGDEVLKVYEVR